MTTNTHTLQIEEILELLPHRFPFLLVDRVLDFEEGRFPVSYTHLDVYKRQGCTYHRA